MGLSQINGGIMGANTLLLNFLIVQQYEKILKELSDNGFKDSVSKVINITEDYNLYKNDNTIKEFTDYSTTGDSKSSLPDYSIKELNINEIEDIFEVAVEATNSKDVFGVIVMCKGEVNNKKLTPMNLFSLNFLSYFERNKDDIENFKKIYIYYSDQTNKDLDMELVEKYKDIVSEVYLLMDESTIKRETVDDDSKTLSFMMKNLNIEGVHNNDIHQSFDIDNLDFDNLKQFIPIEMGMLLDGEVHDSSFIDESNLPPNWIVETSVVDKGIKIPCYSIYQKHGKGGRVLPIAPMSILHSNISSDGSSYCTGNNLTHSLLGVSELSYANANSPLNSNIIVDNSMEVAKAYQLFLIDLLLDVELPN